MTKLKLIEILKKHIHINCDTIVRIKHFESITDELLFLHNAEIAKLQERLDIQINVNDRLLLELREANKQMAKYKKLVETWETLSDMQIDDFESGLIYTHQDKRDRIRRKIDELTQSLNE